MNNGLAALIAAIPDWLGVKKADRPRLAAAILGKRGIFLPDGLPTMNDRDRLEADLHKIDANRRSGAYPHLGRDSDIAALAGCLTDLGWTIRTPVEQKLNEIETQYDAQVEASNARIAALIEKQNDINALRERLCCLCGELSIGAFPLCGGHAPATSPANKLPRLDQPSGDEDVIAEAHNTLDEEQLARALHLPYPRALHLPYPRALHLPYPEFSHTDPVYGINGRCRACGEDGVWTTQIDAAGVAEAYREDINADN